MLDGLLSQKLPDVGLVVANAAGRVVAVHGLALFIDQELLVVPVDVASADWRVVQSRGVGERVPRSWTTALEFLSIFSIFSIISIF